jgi:hypothetical protein
LSPHKFSYNLEPILGVGLVSSLSLHYSDSKSVYVLVFKLRIVNYVIHCMALSFFPLLPCRYINVSIDVGERVLSNTYDNIKRV